MKLQFPGLASSYLMMLSMDKVNLFSKRFIKFVEYTSSTLLDARAEFGERAAYLIDHMINSTRINYKKDPKVDFIGIIQHLDL